MKRLVCFHLFNDFSGSPKVLQMVLRGLAEKGMRIDLITSKGEGALSDLSKWKNVKTNTYAYRFSDNPVVTMARYFGVQLYTFGFALRYALKKDTTFYVNTILPVGAALAGRLTGKRVVYHYHENAFAKGAFYKLLTRAMQALASEIICVSAYQRSFLKREKNVNVVPNAVPAAFVARLCPNPQEAFERKRVLMLGSLKLYKSPLEFMELARRLPQFSFELVVNDTQKNIDRFMKKHQITLSGNLTVYPRQDDVVPFYNRASVVLNLSDKHQFIETFGLTALEAMSAALPVIVPTEGGIAEMVEDGVNGYKIDVQELERIICLIKDLFNDKVHYMSMANKAFQFSLGFKEDIVIDKIFTIINS